MNLAGDLLQVVRALDAFHTRLQAEAFRGVPNFGTDEADQAVLDRAEDLRRKERHSVRV